MLQLPPIVKRAPRERGSRLRRSPGHSARNAVCVRWRPRLDNRRLQRRWKPRRRRRPLHVFRRRWCVGCGENGRTSRDRILVAAGGGGQGCGYEDGGVGGAGGASTGANGGAPYDGGASGGSGGTQIGGGAGGLPGQGSYNRHDGMPGRTGKLAQGGNGGNGGVDHRCNGSNYFCRAGGGGGGGGGYYGGGGGGGGGALYFYGKPGAGGGGGSSYVEQSAQRARMWRGWKTAKGNGLVVFSW